jgi:TRAP-type C4-dicarboxylate transport system permease large subunit
MVRFLCANLVLLSRQKNSRVLGSASSGDPQKRWNLKAGIIYIYIFFVSLLAVVEDGFLEHFPQLLVSCHPQLENDGFNMIQRVEKMFSHVLTSLQLPDRIVEYRETYAKNELFNYLVALVRSLMQPGKAKGEVLEGLCALQMVGRFNVP